LNFANPSDITKGMYKKLLIVLAAIFCGDVGLAFDSKNGDIDIRSDNLAIDINKDKAEFVGKVTVKQNDLIVSSDKLVLFLKKDKVEKATFFQNVIIHIKDQVAYGDQAEYLQSNNLFKLIGNVRLTQNNNEIKGDSFTYNMKTQEVKIGGKKNEVIEKKNERVRAKFNFNLKKDAGS
jgi:lipopolysaccharide transport protein LptA